MNYAKALAMVAATVLTAMVAAMTDNHITTVEWINIFIAGVGACAVFAAPNVPGAKYTKAVLAALMAVLTFLVSAVAGCPHLSAVFTCLSRADLLQVGVIALGALGVWAV